MFFITYTAVSYSRLTYHSCNTPPHSIPPCPCPLSSLAGVPRQHRGEIWKFLSEQYLLRQTVPSRPPANHTPYKELLKQLTSQQHAILIDLGNLDTHAHSPAHIFFRCLVMKLFCYMEKTLNHEGMYSPPCAHTDSFSSHECMFWCLSHMYIHITKTFNMRRYKTNLNWSLLRSEWIFIHNCYWR